MLKALGRQLEQKEKHPLYQKRNELLWSATSFTISKYMGYLCISIPPRITISGSRILIRLLMAIPRKKLFGTAEWFFCFLYARKREKLKN